MPVIAVTRRQLHHPKGHDPRGFMRRSRSVTPPQLSQVMTTRGWRAARAALTFGQNQTGTLGPF